MSVTKKPDLTDPVLKAKLAKGNAKVGIATKVAGKAVKTKAKK